MRLDLNELDHLIAVAEEGSLTRATARPHLSQQALSPLRVLEREVGVPPLERGSTGVTLLPAGPALIEDTRVLNGMTRAALHRARHIGRGETQTLRIGYTPAVTGDELVTLLAPVTDTHPDITPETHQRYPSELTAALLAGDLDIGLCRGMTPPHGLTRTTLGHQRLHTTVRSHGRPAAPAREVPVRRSPSHTCPRARLAQGGRFGPGRRTTRPCPFSVLIERRWLLCRSPPRGLFSSGRGRGRRRTRHP